MNRLNAAMEEAYAAADAAVVVLHAISLDHVSFAAPAHLVTGCDEDLVLGLDGGGSATFTACPFDVVPPGFTDDGPTPARLRVDNVSGLLVSYLKLAVGSNEPITIVYRAYRSDQLGAPGEVIEGMRLRAVSLSASAAEGELDFEQTGTQAFPRLTYSLDDYPALWNL